MENPGLENTKPAMGNGATLAYREQGKGDPVVFVHGTACDLRTWEQQLPYRVRTTAPAPAHAQHRNKPLNLRLDRFGARGCTP